jgi:hypothetical protein
MTVYGSRAFQNDTLKSEYVNNDFLEIQEVLLVRRILFEIFQAILTIIFLEPKSSNKNKQ